VHIPAETQEGGMSLISLTVRQVSPTPQPALVSVLHVQNDGLLANKYTTQLKLTQSSLTRQGEPMGADPEGKSFVHTGAASGESGTGRQN